MGAAGFGQEGVVRLLLGHRDVNPNYSDDNDRTPLWYASANGHAGVVKQLLERGDVGLNRPDVNGRTPLVCATAEGHEEVARLVLEREDVYPDPGDKIDRTPLGCAGTISALLKRKRSVEGGEQEEEKPKRVRGDGERRNSVIEMEQESSEEGEERGEFQREVEDTMMGNS